MMNDEAQDRAVLISMVVETFFYGIFTVLFCFTIWVVICKRATNVNNVNKRLFFTSIAMYILATAHLVTNVYRVVDAFFALWEGRGDPITYFNDTRSATYLLESTAYLLQTLIGDSCLIFRCFIVWERNIWVVLLPLVLLVSCAGASAGVLVNFSRISHAPASSPGIWVAVFFAMTLASNVICTALISFRIWSVDREAGIYRGTKSTLRPVLVVVIESGGIYSASLIALLATYLAHSWAFCVVLESITPITGIVFSMISVRVGLSVAWQDHRSPTTSTLEYNYQPSTVSEPPQVDAIRTPVNYLTTPSEDQPHDLNNFHNTTPSLPSWSLGITGDDWAV